MASGASSRTYSLAGDRDANKSLKAVQAFCELDPASVDSWTLKIRAHLSDAGCLDVIDKRVDLTVRQWLLDSGRVLRDDAPVPVWCDNEVCVMVTKDQSSIKRLSYVARRVRFLQELNARGIIDIRKVDGTVNPADALTKYLQPKDFKRYMDFLYQGTIDANELQRLANET